MNHGIGKITEGSNNRGFKCGYQRGDHKYHVLDDLGADSLDVFKL